MKTAIITGVSRGIGKALAEKFIREGWRIIGTSQTGTIDFTHENLSVAKLDLSSTDSIQECADSIRTLLRDSSADIIINNAGSIFDDGETVLDADKLRKTLEVNTIGTADITEKIIPFINNEAHIVFVSSSAGSISETDLKTHSHHPNQYPAYKISKAALNMYMRTLAMRLETLGSSILVSSVHPGWVRTDMGGDDAPILPAEAADDIYTLAISRPQTGRFWFKGTEYPW